MKQCLFILGMHRSGTSALGGVLSLLGIDFGSKLLKADKNNPKGYFENKEVYELNRTILKENNSLWDDYIFKISAIGSLQFDDYVSRAKKVIKNEFKESDNFAIKDPRNCLLFPIWEAACKKLGVQVKVIIPYRNPLEVSASLSKRDGFSQEKGMLLWCHYFISAENFSRQYSPFFIFFDDFLISPINLLTQVEKLVGIKSSKKQLKDIQGFLDQKIKNNNIPFEDFKNDFPNVVQRLIRTIKNKDFQNHNLFDQVQLEFNLFTTIIINAKYRSFKEQNLILKESLTNFDFLIPLKSTNIKVYFKSCNEGFLEELSVSKFLALENTPQTTSFQIPNSKILK